MSERTFVVIPAFNEEESLPSVLKGLFTTSCKPTAIVVADNNSTDRTAEVARENGAEVVSEKEPGYGAACLAGVAAVRDRWKPEAQDLLVFVDGDGSDFPEDLKVILEPIKEKNFEFVIGSRLRNSDSSMSVGLIPRLGNSFSTWVIKKLYGAEFSDLGPFRAMRFGAYERLGMKDRNWGWTVEMQLLAAENGMRVTEVPVRYRRRTGGESKVSGSIKGTIRASAKILYVLASFSFKKLCSKVSR